jgi:hypothetical protein
MAHPKPLPPIERLLERFYYDNDRDCLCYHPQEYLPADWGHRPVVGQLKKDGYHWIRVLKRPTVVHRVVWAVCTGADPYPLQIDHRDENKSNNRIGNLRIATHGQNQHNASRTWSQTGFKGVSRVNGKFYASVCIDGDQASFGPFLSAEEAHNAYKAVKNALVGQFSPYSVAQ